MSSILQHQRIACLLIALLSLAALAGCASAPTAPRPSVSEPEAIPPAGTGAQAQPRSGLAIALDMIGKPYRYGGASPRGFDCSGLVYYSYRRAGIDVPRTTTEQYRQSEHLRLANLEPGDLIFFRISRRKPSHVGIYAGGGQFIHAPSSGKRVSYASLSDPYWKTRVIGAGRFQ
jgi:murein DD-endopeptidase